MADDEIQSPELTGTPAQISAASKAQAMDWSLVLVSQGIESTIASDETAGWVLRVDEAELSRASEILQQYRLENSHWPWQQKILRDRLSFDWGSLAWMLLLCFFFWLTDQAPRLRELGLMNSAAILHGEWWRLFTAIFLHADAAHLASNISIGFVLLGLAMGRYGTGLGLLAAYLAGAAGNLSGLLLYKNTHLSLGASGMVMGALGLLAAQSLAPRTNWHGWKRFAVALAAGALLFLLMGLAPGTDIIAHAGGFVAGAWFGAMLSLLPRSKQSLGANVLAGIIVCVLVVVPWWRALAGK